ncbi:MAG: deoxynucleoside kinase [Acidovorax sp.]|uniref:deoxynucleoside kinase n=1 Tax=Acidovorax sp. TaxID=1872122 RepID=UPI00391948BC
MMPFVVLEGCDGAGKTTLREMLRAELDAAGVLAVTIGQHSWLHPWHARALVFAREQRTYVPPAQLSQAYLHDKRLHGLRNVEPARKRAVVIADRWFYSDAVYHEVLYGIPMHTTLEQHRGAGTVRPDLLVYVSVDADQAYERILQRGRHTRHYERPADLRRLVAGYEQLLLNSDFTGVELLRIGNALDVEALRQKVRQVLIPAIRQRISAAKSEDQ